MSKTKVIVLTLLMTLCFAPYAMARTESFTMALSIVKKFDKETKTLLPKELNKEQRSAFTKTAKKNKKETTAAIKSLRRSEGPSPRRFKRLYKIVDQHTGDHIKEVDKLASTLLPKDRAAVEGISAKLKGLRDEFLEELKGTSFSEREPARGIKAEPVLDRSPYEERPGDVRGIYDR